MKLGTADIRRDWKKDGVTYPLPYYAIRDYYRNSNKVLIKRPGRTDGQDDYPSDIHFQQLLQKVNATYDFDLPIEIPLTKVGSSVGKFYLYDKIRGGWIEEDEFEE